MPQAPQPPPPLRLLEVHEVAYLLKCSQETVRRLIRDRKLAAVRLGIQSWRVQPSDLQTFIDANRVQTLKARIASGERELDTTLERAKNALPNLIDERRHKS